jgi:SAM-dependent methyltransferase
LLADLVGPRGRIAAYDLAPDTLATIGRRVAVGIVTPVEARVGSVVALPYADDTFDALWCANTSQYLTDDDLRTALKEYRRVVRPGGLVALKESDRALTHFPTAPPLLVAHLFEAMARAGGVQAAGNLRGASLAGWLRDAGMVGVHTRTILVERGAPLDEVTRRYWDELLSHLAPTAMEQAIRAEERAVWAALLDVTGRSGVLDDPACYCREGHVVLVGRVSS